MKLQTIGRRGSAAAAVLALSVTFAACASDDEPETGAADDETSSATEDTETSAPEETEDAADEFDVFGDACGQLPQGDEAGSLDSMVVDPVGTAASTNPLLTQLVGAVQAAGLVDTLNTVEAATVFAPFNGAFDELPADTVQGLVDSAGGDPNSDLGVLLQHHVVAGEQLDTTAVVGEQEPLTGAPLTIEGDEDGMTVSDGTTTANVLCGNIPTANATVYVIDQVLMGAQG